MNSVGFQKDTTQIDLEHRIYLKQRFATPRLCFVK